MAELKWLIKRGNYYYFGDAPVHATGVSLDKSSITLTTAGQTEQLTATIIPSDAVEKKVHWSSSDTTIATVSSTGLVTCVTPGECTITATCDGVSATCSVIDTVIAYVDLLLIGGGGGGGGYFGGGGGAGGVIQCINYSITSGNYNINIGCGGCGWLNGDVGCNGGDSCFDLLIAYGGGGGGGTSCQSYGLDCYFGRDGGSGGGDGFGNGYYGLRDVGGSGCIGQGCNGGGGGYTHGSGGGGGAGGCGCKGNCTIGGQGGNGIQSNISGTNVWYAGGGSGFDGYSATTVSASNGGTASGYGTESNATYCGAGGGGTQKVCGNGHGGNGIFIARYPTSCGYNVTGGTKYTCGEYTIHCFTSNGTLTVN